MKLEQIRKIAEEVKEVLKPFCSRIEIAGSIRREKPECKDIEIVCIPAHSGVPLAKYFLDSKTRFYRNGKKYKQFSYGPVKVDLFITDINHWGLTYLIRTGSSDFNKYKIIPALKENEYIMLGGKLFQKGYGTDIFIFEEADLFRAAGMNFIEPINRV